MRITSQKQINHLQQISKIGVPLAAKACNEIRQKNIEKYNLSPKLCKTCSIPIEYDKRWNTFCSSSCSATDINKERIRNGIIYYGTKRRRCTSCNKPISSKDITLNLCHKCGKETRLLKRIDEIEKKMISTTECKMRGDEIKLYLIHKRGHQCEKCRNAMWNSKPIPLNGHHRDGNYLNNHPDNLKLLCPNCHAQTDNYCRKNKPVNKRPLYGNHKYGRGRENKSI